MTGAQRTPAAHEGPATQQAQPTAGRSLRILVYSDDSATREAVRLAVGRRPARDVEVAQWHECATADAVIMEADKGGHDLFILDGEAVPYGGLGLCRQLKHEIYNCPPIIVLTGRPQDAWLAAWSYADLAVPHPLDPIALAGAVASASRLEVGTPAGA